MLNSNHRRSKSRSTKRRGASMVEAVFTLPIFLWVLFAMLDLGIAALRMNALSDAARRAGRSAVIHGSMVPDRTGSWGPTAYSGAVADGSPMVSSLATSIPTMEPEDVSVQMAWLDGDNRPGDRVRVTLQYQHTSLVPGLLPWGPFDLEGSTTMTILN
ncbi:TadE/TadG family type IV pilus assembly protein [Rhodopirellula baltica]|uniref:TadE family protein n=1 Tax=Rhodopirellula baltica WH47 TaxID=991778 RepID=F2AW01_RHOBT|nr:TadE/TadG family type IV pilus assembly protein [Rhodopirellula baltica]EGF26156.1 TadE family protein [Rhodopirellula baltica WH47]